MNKTININLGGYFFHIDENAYKKLRRYLDAIAKSLSDDPQGKNEIIADIEARISELLSEKISDPRQVVNEQDISDIIKIMGEPEDYSEVDEDYTDKSYTYNREQRKGKKLFRDGDQKFIAGVATGLGHYFNVDVVWIRLIFILTTVFSGFGLLAYIIFWIVTPEALTTAEKLQMEGEPVNIDNIEKKIREELGNAADTIKDGASEVGKKVNDGIKKGSKRAQSGFQDFLDTLGKIIVAIFKVVGKLIGVFIIIVSAILIISFIIGAFSIGSFEVLGIGDEYLSLPPFMMDSMLPNWLLAICLLILIGFPFLVLFVLGLRILSSNVKQFSKATSLTLLGIWIVAMLMIVFTGIEFGTSKAYDGTKIERKDLTISAKDTVSLSLVNDDDIHYSYNFRTNNNKVEVNVNGTDKLYSNYVKVDVRKSESDQSYIRIRKVSEGRNPAKANESAEAIDYKLEVNDNKIKLNGYFLSNYRSFIKDEVVYVTLYLNEGATVYFEKSSKRFLYNVENTDGIYDNDMAEHHFVMTKDGLDCTDCEEKEEIKKEI